MTLSVSMTCLSVSFSDLCSYLGRQASLTLSQVRGESNLNSDLKPADPLADSIADFIAKNTEAASDTGGSPVACQENKEMLCWVSDCISCNQIKLILCYILYMN